MSKPLMSSTGIEAQLSLHRSGFTLDVDLSLPGQGVSVLFGRSGSGKTTLLRCLAGLEKHSHGRTSFNGEIWQDGERFVPTKRRPIGYVFQEPSLFPHLSGRKNLEFALRHAGTGIPGLSFDDIVALLGIAPLLDKLPARLSGGERQRLAIARALLIRPKLLLMDEPLASLDAARKLEILPYLEQLKREVALPMIYVTHAPEEVARLADHLVAMENGRVLTAGPLQETLARLDFPIRLGEEVGVVLQARVSERDAEWQLIKVSFSGGELWLRDTGHPVGNDVRVRIFARDISLALDKHQDTSIVNILPAVVEKIASESHAGLSQIRLKVGDSSFVARLSRRSTERLGLRAGSQVWAQIKSVAIIQ